MTTYARYYEIEKAVREIIEADTHFTGIRTFIEQDIIFSAEACPAVYIYLDRRDTVEAEQRLAAGRRTDYRVRLSLWCVEWHLDSTEEASRLRDELIESVEVVLTTDRTLKGASLGSWLEGGEFLSGLGDSGFLSAGEIVLVARAKSEV